jgi:uncharacterized membrane protein YoaK (UPF0700 family)
MAMAPERSRDVLLVLLAIVTGATDATVFTRLGHVFASVITGNLILLGTSAVKTDGHLALFAGCALAGYAVGVALAAPRRGELDSDGAVWPRAATFALVPDLALLVVFAVMWEIDGHHPSRGMQIVLLVLCAAAMGVQSTAVRRLGQVSTTYLTSTLTGLVESLVARRWSAGESRSLAILAVACGGAAAGIALVMHAWRWLPLLQLLPLTIVLVTAGARFGPVRQTAASSRGGDPAVGEGGTSP